jgi:hypothetical protein
MTLVYFLFYQEKDILTTLSGLVLTSVGIWSQ